MKYDTVIYCFYSAKRELTLENPFLYWKGLQVIVLIVHVIVTYDKLFLSSEAISIAIRDFFNYITFLGVIFVMTNIIL